MNLMEKMFGTHSEREIKRITPLVDKIEALRPQMQALTDEQMAEDLFAIVDNGGRLRDVVVEHEIYGQITVDLILENRCDVQDFLDKISKSTARPLSILTNGKHYHTVEADREAIFDRIEQKLRLLGYLQETI